jgi:hypothetical protein
MLVIEALDTNELYVYNEGKSNRFVFESEIVSGVEIIGVLRVESFDLL